MPDGQEEALPNIERLVNRFMLDLESNTLRLRRLKAFYDIVDENTFEESGEDNGFSKS